MANLVGGKINESKLLEKIETPSLKPEKIANPELKAESAPSRVEKIKDIPGPREKINEGNIVVTSQALTAQKQRAAAIDTILAEGLSEIFLHMKPEEQKIFQKKGEETVNKINELLNQTKVKINTIVSLIRKWLSLIKGINKFFLEQEVKIKADKIIRLKDR